jgi:hypothetical protein
MSGLVAGLGLAGLLSCAQPDSSRPVQVGAVHPGSGQFALSCPDSGVSPSALRRLSRFEYESVLSDVFELEEPVGELFPRDEISLGFDNQADTLGVTDQHVAAYLELATRVAARQLESPERLHTLVGCSTHTVDCLRQLANRLGLKLQRRPLSEEEVDRLIGPVADALSPSAFAEAVTRMLAALLSSPEFLYRFERRDGAGGVVGERLAPSSGTAPGIGSLASPWVLAARLAFLIWGSAPDDTLLSAAAEGRLSTPEDVEREARRLLADAKAQRGLWHFYVQWLELTELGHIEKDRRLLTYWDADVRASLEGETRRFLEAVLWQDDARWETLLTAPYTFVNARLADFYDLPFAYRRADSEELVRVELSPESQRAGLLTHGSILSTQAKSNQTDPIRRGKFIREQFFCTSPPPPPPNLVVTAPSLDPRQTTRERFAQHRADPACSGCHRLLDATGFVFEHFDASGRYRATENGLPIDATGYLADTDIEGEIDGIPELADRLAASTQVHSCFIRQWFRYTFGRAETDSDRCTLNLLEQRFAESDGNLLELVIQFTQTDPFLLPAPAPAAEDVQ